MQLASGTSGLGRWYRPALAGTIRELRPKPGYHDPMESSRHPFDGRPGVSDTLGRALRDLRISVTDRCNFRCTYCMPKEVFGRDYAFLPHDQVLTFEEIERLARVFVGLGVEKLRITGGEPLVRRDLPHLIAMLAATASAGRRRAGPDAHDQRIGPAGACPAAGRSGPAPGDGQPRFARRRGVRAR